MTAKPLCLLLMLTLAAGCTQPGPPPEPPEHARLRAAVAPLQAWVESQRGAAIGAPVSASVTAAPLAPHLRTVLPDATEERDRALFAAIGLLGPRREDRAALLEGVHVEAEAAWAFRPRELLLAAQADPTSPAFERAVVHGLAHALQERYRTRQWLERLTPPGYDRRDETLAWALLVEGEAHYLAALRAGALDPKALREQGERAIASGHLGQLIGALGPLGAAIVADLKQRGGWAAIDALFQRRPESTEQLLHPEKLLPKREPPVRFKLPDLSRSLGKGWRQAGQDSLGELLLRVLFAKLTGKPQLEACAGWAGDRLQVYRHPHEVYGAFLWLTTWDTPKDAKQFAAAVKAAGGRLKEVALRVKENDVWVGGLRFAQVEPRAFERALARADRELKRSDLHPAVWHVPRNLKAE